MSNDTSENDQTRVADLENTVTELRHTIEVMLENKRLSEQVTHLGDETIRLSYQQAADWVRMSNLVTWSLGSIYVVAAVIALNGAMQQQNQIWRALIGGVVIFLAVMWALVDFSYLCSSRSARRYLISIENQWPDRQPLPRGFFIGQQRHRYLFGLVTALLYASALVLAGLALVIAIQPVSKWVGLS
jgi:hypothetical protein